MQALQQPPPVPAEPAHLLYTPPDWLVSRHRIHLGRDCTKTLTKPFRTARDRLLAHQIASLEALYQTDDRPQWHTFRVEDDARQQRARNLLAGVGCDLREDPDVRRKFKIGGGWVSRTKFPKRYRVWVCNCGYNRQQSDIRMTPWDETGCLAHVAVVMQAPGNIATSKIVHVLIYANHNCEKALMVRLPAVPLHTSVYHHALIEVRSGVKFPVIRERNGERIEQGSPLYIGINEPNRNSHRYEIKAYDSVTLYRKYYLSLGVGLDPRQQAHVVMHRWMTPGNPGYNEQIALNVPHFESLAVGQERFEAVIITEQMREAAWRFGHRQQMILDGTFGVSQERLLCFILMVVDQNYRGVPVGFILFTPLAEHLATHGSYDADVLVRLLQAWKVGIEQGRNDEFEPYSWGNGKRSRYPRILRGERANDRIIAQAIEDIKTRVKSLEDRLLNALTFEAALNALQEETALFLRMKEDERLPGEVRATAAGAWDYLGYLRKTWVKENLWMAWAEIGRTRLAQALDIPLGSVINTSNHLESFNNVLKNGWLRRCSTGRGRRLRTDVLVALLITRVIPGIFRTRAIAERERNWMANLLEGLLAPQLIDAANLNRRAAREQRALERRKIQTIPDKWRAQEIFARGRVQQLWLAFDFSRLNAVCVPEFNPNRLRIFDEMNYELCLRYTVMMGCWTGRCSCPDFSQRGGACKHLRALQLSINTADNRPSGLPLIHFPSSLEEAKEAEQQLLPQPSTSTLQPFQPHPTSTKEYEKQVLESVTELGEQLMESGEEFAVPEDAEVVVEET
ncbi:hypothetical protein QFC20_006082 [Naganishia adeliensis]|uniref:Uncharacterized protein n=1 Tax=Naganishia adeliensis TaxID=92952 RepID=A0ACC2VHB0_9TREE|nr:hypothetical protein QFC20_006082 [Naganishia adeliensis]